MSSSKKLDELIQHMEQYVECWKQFNHYLGLARSKQFTQEDEDQFLEVKSVIAQELELILHSIEGGVPSKDDVHTLVAEAPSIRYLSELNEGGLKAIEGRWHKLYLAWQSALGQLKVQQKQLEAKPRWSFFGRKS